MQKSQTILQEEKYAADTYASLPVVLNKAKGVKLWDENGKEYLDFMSAYSAVSFGHTNERLLEVFKKQAETLTIVSRAFHIDNLGPFLEKACNLSGFDMALPMNTGAEGVETAIKAARRWGHLVKGVPDGEQEIIVCDGNFHGRTTTIISFSPSENSRRGFGPLPAGFKTIPFGDAKALEEAITDKTVAFLTEPMQGEGGIIIPEHGWLKKVREITKKNNVLLLVDEVQTGMGRTGKNFAFQHELGELNMPDGMVLGKAIGGGFYPVSMFLSSKEVMDVFDNGSHGSTWGGNALASAIGLESLNMLEEENFAEKSHDLGLYMKNEIIAMNNGHIKEVRGSGLWIGVDMNIDAHEVCERLLDKGVLAKETAKGTIRFAPPLIITKDQIDEGLKAFKEVIESM